MADVYDAKGRRIVVRCPCPKCRHHLTRVLRTGESDGGEVVRQRLCLSCEHRWFTAQEPEYLVPASRIFWPRDRPLLRADA